MSRDTQTPTMPDLAEVRNLIKQRGYGFEPSQSGDENIFKSGENSQRYFGGILRAGSGVELHYLQEGESVSSTLLRVDELLELRAILDEGKIPYTEVPSREEAGPILRDEVMQEFDSLSRCLLSRE